MLDRVAGLVPAIKLRAASHDVAATLPVEDLDALRDAGALAAPDADLRTLMILLGNGNPALGRLIEAHVNALQLVRRYGTAAQVRSSLADAAAGHLFGLWVTDAPGTPVRSVDGVLEGAKMPCSGVGAATRTLITVETPPGSMMAVVPVDAVRTERLPPIAGLRAACQGRATFDGVPCPALIGSAGDYLREPELSCGAWRTSAITLGALQSLIEALRTHLVARGHHHAPLQQERFGLALIARQTAELWVDRAAAIADDPAVPVLERVSQVNLARIAVEAACLDAIRHVQRSAGLAAFVPGPMERIARDIATYLRQPAPDAVLTEAAAYYLERA